VEALLADEDGRAARGVAARQLAVDRYSWQDIARRLEGIYNAGRGPDERESVAA
jgi:glycosyltransferase involved in cell wall biosynthesis